MTFGASIELTEGRKTGQKSAKHGSSCDAFAGRVATAAD
jgi:hypothetical protein